MFAESPLSPQNTSKVSAEDNSPVTWDQHSPVQSSFVSGVPVTYQNVQNSLGAFASKVD